MSSILSKKYKVALFVSGLGSNEYFFDETIRKMKTEQPNLVIEYSGVIDMSDYNPNENQFYGLSNNSLMPSSKALTSFCSKIANIVSSAKENGNKVILVRTKLGTKIKGINEKKIVYSSYDSIDNQALKLKKIINEICRINPETEIYLIGHSQGGLVNLKTSTLVPEKIKNLISISTPYSPVTLAYLLREIEFVANIFDKSLIMKVEPNDYIDYEERIKTLSDLKYINNLKNEWNNLIIRPKLNVIAGISSHLMTSEYFIIFCIPFELNYRYPFDGLVLGR
ncbi:MAG: alpha/beta hydrolase [Bacilli bacterium]